MTDYALAGVYNQECTIRSQVGLTGVFASAAAVSGLLQMLLKSKSCGTQVVVCMAFEYNSVFAPCCKDNLHCWVICRHLHANVIVS